MLKETLEGAFPLVVVRGEISNLKKHTSGHTYFTIKDERAQIAAVLWRSRAPAVRVEFQDGMNVTVTGRLTLYGMRGVYQIEILAASPIGIGELQQEFDRLKRKLHAEGLFDERRKKPLPGYPERIGIVTSPTGAALQDMINIIRRRFPPAQLFLSPVRVQGRGASGEIAAAIRHFNEFGKIDVIIVGRGGGSLEDLWAFNEEPVARAIYDSSIPVVSAVGHEVDFTIADFVADLRAPTPSGAAELVVPDKSAVLDNLRKHCYTINRKVQVMLEDQRGSIRQILRSHTFHKPLDLVRQLSQRVDELERTLSSRSMHQIAILKSNTTSLTKRLLTLDPQATLQRGYAIVHRNGSIVTSALGLAGGEEIETTFHDGRIRSVVR
jgi:exodeoxyribonuclease VII large subunit